MDEAYPSPNHQSYSLLPSPVGGEFDLHDSPHSRRGRRGEHQPILISSSSLQTKDDSGDEECIPMPKTDEDSDFIRTALLWREIRSNLYGLGNHKEDTGADSKYIISPPATDYLAPILYGYVNIHAGEELREILGHSLQSLTPQLRKELFTKAPTDTNECAQAVAIWIARLNVIKSGLASFPMPVDRGEISTTMESLTIAPPPDWTTQAPQASPSQASITACLERDQYQCIITGRKFSDGSSTEVVPIIPFTFANRPCCRDLDFWKMLEMFFGSEAIDTLFAGLLERVDSLENLITLDSSIHTMFNSGALTLTPRAPPRDPIPVINDYRGSYCLVIDYDLGVRSADFIQSTKGFSPGEVGKLRPWSRIAIACHEGMPGHAPILPLPSYFALRAFILSLKNTIAYKPPIPDEFSFSDASSTPPSPATPVDFGNQYPTDPATSDNPCADPVLEASAILQDLVDEGALERSP